MDGLSSIEITLSDITLVVDVSTFVATWGRRAGRQTGRLVH